MLKRRHIPAPAIARDMPPAAGGAPRRIAVVAPRNMRFSPEIATSIDLYIHEIALTSRYADAITVVAQRTDRPFDDVQTAFWDAGDGPGACCQTVERLAPDLVVVNQHLPTASRLSGGMRAVGGGRARVALVRHNFIKPPTNRVSAMRKLQKLAALDGLAFVSSCCRDTFRTEWAPLLGRAKLPPLFVTPNGIDTALWRPAEKAEQVVFCGRLSPEKGVLEAARGIRGALGRHAGWRAVFILDASGADDPDLRAYRRAVLDEIAAAGDRAAVRFNIPHDDVRRILGESAIAIAPTQNSEPFGRVAIEALASGAALIASNAGGFVEIVGEGAGVLLETPSEHNIRAALDAVMADPGLRRALAARGRERAVTRYDLRNAAAAFDALVEGIL